MKCLVMGGNRYIGLQLVRELVEQGHSVTVLNSHEADLPEGVERLHGERHDPGVLQEVLGPRRDSFDAVFDNTAYTPDHLKPMIELFRGRVAHFIFTSSIAVYEIAGVQPVTESSAVSRDAETAMYGAYGAGKVQCEELLAREFEDNALPFTALRVSHTCGPMSPAVTREPGTFKRLEEGRPLLIGGRTDAMVHFIHTRDAARAIAAPLGKPQAAGRVYNVAGMQFCSIADYMQCLADAAGLTPEIIRMPDDLPEDMRSPIVHWLEASRGSMVFGTERIREELDWKPAMTIAEGLADSYRWFNETGRDKYDYDFSEDERILAEINRRGPAQSGQDRPSRAVFRAEFDTLKGV